jgi:hypothetical protein
MCARCCARKRERSCGGGVVTTQDKVNMLPEKETKERKKMQGKKRIDDRKGS